MAQILPHLYIHVPFHKNSNVYSNKGLVFRVSQLAWVRSWDQLRQAKDARMLYWTKGQERENINRKSELRIKAPSIVPEAWRQDRVGTYRKASLWIQLVICSLLHHMGWRSSTGCRVWQQRHPWSLLRNQPWWPPADEWLELDIYTQWSFIQL